MTGDYGPFQPTKLHQWPVVHRLTFAGEVFLWIRRELRDAALGAEEVALAVVIDVAGGAVGIDHHPADRIDDALGHGLLEELGGGREPRFDVDWNTGHLVERAL